MTDHIKKATYLKPHYLAHLLETSWNPNLVRHSVTGRSDAFLQSWETSALKNLGKLWISFKHFYQSSMDWWGASLPFNILQEDLFSLTPHPISRKELNTLTNQLCENLKSPHSGFPYSVWWLYSNFTFWESTILNILKVSFFTLSNIRARA